MRQGSPSDTEHRVVPTSPVRTAVTSPVLPRSLPNSQAKRHIRLQAAQLTDRSGPNGVCPFMPPARLHHENFKHPEYPTAPSASWRGPRRLCPRTPNDCAGCREAIAPSLAPARLVAPCAQTKSPRRRKKSIATRGQACPRPIAMITLSPTRPFTPCLATATTVGTTSSRITTSTSDSCARCI